MVTKTVTKVRCDVRDCKNVAEYTFEIKGRQGKFFICRECLETLIDEGRKLRVPKSPKNVIKKQLELRAEELNYAEK